MKMKEKVGSRIKHFLSCTDIGHASPNHSIEADVREEYANAFRTESYLDFWTRVIELSDGICDGSMATESATAARLSSYRLFGEYLLDPDQPTVIRILTLARTRPATHALLSNYFAQTANASILCGILLRDVDATRVKYRSLKATLSTLESTSEKLTDRSNPIAPVSSPSRVKSVKSDCSTLLQSLESRRDKCRAKLRLINKLKRGSALVLVAVTVSLSVVVLTHALSLFVAIPALISASFGVASATKLARTTAQLDAAAKGTYTLNRDFETITRLVARLNDELAHIATMAEFQVKLKGQDLVGSSQEVARQMRENECSLVKQLDELEEHLYLCFMTINRARKLVIQEILNPVRTTNSIVV